MIVIWAISELIDSLRKLISSAKDNKTRSADLAKGDSAKAVIAITLT
jgi:hypothetical protein